MIFVTDETLLQSLFAYVSTENCEVSHLFITSSCSQTLAPTV